MVKSATGLDGFYWAETFVKAMTLVGFGVAIILCAGASMAQDDWAERVAVELGGCLQGKSGIEAQSKCIGVAASSCQEENEAGSSTQGMAACLQWEAQAWDKRLNSVWGEAMALAKQSDAEDSAQGFSVERAGALLKAQRAWIDYREGECAFARAQFGGGTMGIPSSAACMMDMNARRALALEAKRDFMHEGF